MYFMTRIKPVTSASYKSALQETFIVGFNINGSNMIWNRYFRLYFLKKSVASSSQPKWELLMVLDILY